MALLSRLLGTSSLAASLGLYLPAVICQKALGLLRVLLFAYLLGQVEYGLWALGMMLFQFAAAMLTLGSNNGLVRYASHFDVQNRLLEFYRRLRWAVLGVGVALTAVAFVGSEPIAYGVFSSRSELARVPFDRQLWVCWAALGNGLAVAIYHNLLGFAMGLRMYRFVAALEVSFSVLFTVVGAAALLLVNSSLAVLSAHLAVLVLVLIVGVVLLDAAVRRRSRLGGGAAAEKVLVEPPSEAEELATAAVTIDVSNGEATGPQQRGAVRCVFSFGCVSLVGNLFWQAAGYVTFWMVNRRYGTGAAGVFGIFLLLSQPILFLANAAWTVLFTHVARRWEEGKRRMAMMSLETGYKAVTLSVLALAVILKATAPLWVKILPESYRLGLATVGGLLMYFRVVNHLTLPVIVAKLRERPSVIALTGAVGAATIGLLAWWWMPQSQSTGCVGYVQAARASGVGMYVGGGLVAVTYLLLARVRLRFGTWLVLALPAVLLLPDLAAAGVLACVLAATVLTKWIFTRGEKRLLRQFAEATVQLVRRKRA